MGTFWSVPDGLKRLAGDHSRTRTELERTQTGQPRQFGKARSHSRLI
ncbi:hypothetical protein ACFFLM_03315 [Deinococcus oregonensis]|uniref:Uncharacterized protein n=1 Tax=Deinococcus oregonensis TaxID=1805970 RepID=A0ABV6AXR7_9DEIO